MSTHQSQSGILSWQKKTHATHPVVERLKTMTSELELIQNEICGLLGASDGTPAKRHSLPESAGSELMRFRSAVDQLRRTLWFYCDDDAQASSQASIMPQGQKLVPQAQPGHSQAEIPCEQTSGSFFDRLNLVIDGYIQPNGSISRSSRKIKL